jgi:hypothetical protein
MIFHTVQEPRAVDVAAREEVIRRMAGSETFRPHPVLRQLLLYLVARTAGEDPGELKEYVIGVEAFSKPATYDPQKDSSVRVQVSRLRKMHRGILRKGVP